MNESDLRLLKASQDKLLRIYCRDGEILVARVSYVWDEYADVTYDVALQIKKRNTKNTAAERHIPFVFRISSR